MRLAPLPLVGLLAAACGGGEVKNTGPDACAEARQELRRRLGPELAEVRQQRPLPMPEPSPGGCALVYTEVPEETPEEMPEGEGGDLAIEQRLAVSLPDAAGRQVLELLEPVGSAPGSVTLTLDLRDITGDGTHELVVQEDGGGAADGYRGLRILSYTPAEPKTHLVFAELLQITTPEGLSIIPSWQIGQVGDKRGLLFDGAGTKKIFVWNEANRRFEHDAAATAKANPAPPPPPAPPPAEEPAAAPVAESPPKKADDKKKAEDKKAADKAAKPGKKGKEAAEKPDASPLDGLNLGL